MHFSTSEGVPKTFWFCDFFIKLIKTVHLQQFKGMQSSKLAQLSSIGYVCDVFDGNRR